MEIGLDNNLPTFSGGLGVLAGDTLRSAADLGVGMVGVTLLYRKGYFRQSLDEAGNQTESEVEWLPESYLDEMEPRVSVEVEGRAVTLRAWRYLVQGIDALRFVISNSKVNAAQTDDVRAAGGCQEND